MTSRTPGAMLFRPLVADDRGKNSTDVTYETRKATVRTSVV